MAPNATGGSLKQSPIGVGIVGLGVRGMHAMARNMAETFGEVGLRIVALSDRNGDRMKEAKHTLVRSYADVGEAIDPALYSEPIDLIDDPDVDLVVITSITDSHLSIAVPALHSGKKVYCEKPLAQNAEDSVTIVAAERAAANPLLMGFTRRYEPPWQKARDLLDSGAIGDLVMVQVRTVIPYHRYLTGWWRRREWSGGALNDKGSHIFDVFNWFADSRAVSVAGLGGKSMIEPDPTAPERCQECERECMYRRRAFLTGAPISDDLAFVSGSSWVNETEEKFTDDSCVYRPGSDLYHNGSLQFAYENGVIASYFYTIFGPPSTDEETMELIGTDGRLILTRQSGQISIVGTDGTSRDIDCRTPDFGDSHFGADKALIRELRLFVEGALPSVSALAGLEATRMVVGGLMSMDDNGRKVMMTEVANAGV